MKHGKILFVAVLTLFLMAKPVWAGDFEWTRSFNRQAKDSPQAFMAKLAERFHLNDVQAVSLKNIFASPADAYIMLRLGEMRQGDLKNVSRDQAVEAVRKYRANRDKGWVAVAESLGVETGCKEFMALKKDHDLHGPIEPDKVAAANSEKGMGAF